MKIYKDQQHELENKISDLLDDLCSHSINKRQAFMGIKEACEYLSTILAQQES